MMKRSIFLLGALALAVSACASDPNKNAADARDAETEAQRKAQQEAADRRSDQAQDQAEHERRMTTASAAGQPEATRERVEADAKLVEEREVAKAKSLERFEKADARANELRDVVARAGAKATTKARDALKAVDDQRVQAKTSIDRISAAAADDLKRAKDYADYQLDTLEGYVKRAAKEVDDFK
ncbi:MAG: hypothetical protein KIT84_28375 [Labilithrix sp.]|nr:hypothetical protein [Labilithrix sp.]MCW5814976.1 hypothetical protein [Labilithrix sp.]